MSEASTPARRHHDSVRSSRSRQSSAPNDELSYSSLADLVRDVPTSPLSAGSPHRRTFGWPLSPSPNASSIRLDAGPSEAKAKPGVDELSTWRLMTLTVAIAGAQVAWTIEQASGSPYLISLKLSRELTALVWIAGPLSGLLAQPIVGAMSDISRSRYRRRKYLAGSSVVVVLCLLAAGFARQIAAALIEVAEEEDWDPARPERIRHIALLVAVPSFAVLDFGLNALQAACRALILDTAPPHQQNIANAWQGRMTHAANVLGFALGMANLSGLRALDWLPHEQFTRLSALGCVVLAACSAVTCLMTPEAPPEDAALTGPQSPSRIARIKLAYRSVIVAARSLPVSVRRLFVAQFFSWLGWFTCLFFTTVFVSAIWHREHPRAAADDEAGTRAGSRALLFYALVALATGTLLPQLQAIGRWRSVLGSDRRWARPLRAGLRRLTDRNLWTASQLIFSLLMVATFFAQTVVGATVIVALTGVCWAIACWVPYALVGEQVRLLQEEEQQSACRPVSQIDVLKGLAQRVNTQRALTECEPLLGRRKSSLAVGSDGVPIERPSGKIGGSVLGLHNVAIVMPQFVTSLVASIIFKLAGPSFDDTGAPRRHGLPVDSTSWVLLFGAISSLLAVVAVRRIPAPASEERYVDDLRSAPLPEAEDDNSPAPPGPWVPIRVHGDEPRRISSAA